MTVPRKTKINTTFVSIDGMRGTRSKMDDFRSVRARIFARLEAIDAASADRLLIPGVNAYNQGDYEGALSYFLKSVTEISAFEEELRPHITVIFASRRFMLFYRLATSRIARHPQSGSGSHFSSSGSRKCRAEGFRAGARSAL